MVRMNAHHTGRLIYCILFMLSILSLNPVSDCQAQTDSVYCKDATRKTHQKIYRNLTQNIILPYLSYPPDSTHEEKWMDAIRSMIFLQYQSDWSNQRIQEALQIKHSLSSAFRYLLFEYLYALHIRGYGPMALSLLQQETNPTHIALYYHYWRDIDQESPLSDSIRRIIHQQIKINNTSPVALSLWQEINGNSNSPQPAIDDFFDPDYLPGQVLLLCLLEKDRNKPGFCLVRDSFGHWMRDDQGKPNTISILGRSLNNLPVYLSNGNTPQGLFRMDGLDQSQSSFIGPTTNIQLTLPFEYRAGHFFRDSTLSDSSWKPDSYAALLPDKRKKHQPVWESYLAGKAGRHAIIIHGTTIDPGWYTQAAFYPFIPTEGCLTTRETWDPVNGLRLFSDQQQLVNLVQQAGGPQGYVIVLNVAQLPEPESLQRIVDRQEKPRERN